MYKSTDGAESWTPVKLPEEVNGPNGLTVDPQNSNRLYLAAWTRATGMHGTGGGIFLSEDGGKSWKNVLDRDQHVYDVTVDPRDAKISLCVGIRVFGVALDGPGRALDAHPGIQLQMGSARDARS